jgi:putative Mg2+ transporter-C (MgtC) family protein
MISWQEILLRLGLAAVLGAMIGLERERKDWSAGMRTHMMVCVGAALAMIVSTFGFSDILGQPNVTLDPSRIAAQVISGIGFIGAGTILFLKPGFIRGLTTASGLWTVSAIGLASGSGMYFAAMATTGIAIVILLILQPFERRISRHFKQKYIRITIDLETDPAKILNLLFSHQALDIDTFSFDKSEAGFIIEIKFDEFNLEKMQSVVSELHVAPGIKEIFWAK